MVDLTNFAGFPLDFDPDTLIVSAGDGLTFKRNNRLGRDVVDVVCYPEQVEKDKTVYMMDILEDAPAEVRASLDRYGLMYSLVLLPPLKIGAEFVKTTGHYHPAIPGTVLGYPEVYTQLYGKLLLALQRRSATQPDQIMEYVIVEMMPGFVITIPPNYAHCLINPTGEPGLMAGLYGKDFKPDYEMTRGRHGLAYYLLSDGDRQVEFSPNPNYPDRPEITWLKDISGTCFSPDYQDEPVWDSFLSHPSDFAFLTDPQAVQEKFPDWK